MIADIIVVFLEILDCEKHTAKYLYVKNIIIAILEVLVCEK